MTAFVLQTENQMNHDPRFFTRELSSLYEDDLATNRLA